LANAAAAGESRPGADGRTGARGIDDTAENTAEAVSKIVPCSGLDIFATRFVPAAGRPERSAGSVSARIVNKVQKLVI
jgi:hypothetical protein